MRFFRGNAKKNNRIEKEAERKAIQKDTLKLIDTTNRQTAKLTRLLQENKPDINEMIFYATGGDKRDDR